MEQDGPWYLISAKGDRAILELGTEGKLLRTIQTPGDPHEVRELPDGHLLIACGEGEAMLELDREGQTVWKLGTQDVPNNPLRLISGFQRLPDGHTLVINWLGHGYLATTAQFFELDEQKRIVRQFTDHAHFVSINKVQLLDARLALRGGCSRAEEALGLAGDDDLRQRGDASLLRGRCWNE